MASSVADHLEMSVDPEGVIDLEQNSVLSWLGLALSVVGLFSLIEPIFFPLSLLGAGIACLPTIFARSWQIAPFARRISAVAIFLGCFGALAGITQRWYWESVYKEKAISLATSYMQALSRGDRNMAIKLVGLPQMVVDEKEDSERLTSEKLSREQQAVRTFLKDKPIQEVIKRGTSAKWKPIGVVSSSYSAGVIDKRIAFIDEAETNQSPFYISVRMQPPQKYSVDTKTRWIVNSIEHGDEL